jgi:hypothetical protein
MCEECEQAEPLAAVYWRKANRYGWRPPVAATPRYDNGATPRRSAPADVMGADANKAEVSRCA